MIGGAGRDHVLILDTSAWMGSSAAVRATARCSMKRAIPRAPICAPCPRRDRVMLVRADALATPATAFEPDRQRWKRRSGTPQPGSSALNLEQALEFAQQSQRLQSERAGRDRLRGSGPRPRNKPTLTSCPPICEC